MSKLIVEVVKIKEIMKHPNADRLDIVKVKGWECVVQKDKFKVDDLVIYTPIDSVLPIDLSDKIGVTNYLSKGRVRTAKLRGVYSQGLIIDVKYLPDDYSYNIGDDLKDILGIIKYEPPPPPLQMSGEQRTKNPDFYEYTEIENIKNYPDVLVVGEQVVITEKIHGTNFRCGNIDDEIHVGSHHTNLKENYDNLYWQAADIYNLKDILEPGMIIYGEVYGYGVQKLAYNLKKIDVLFFDLKVNNKYVNTDDFNKFCEDHNLPQVPILYEGSWDISLMNLANGVSNIANHIKEGIVIKPQEERWDRNVGRVILKHISEKYLLKDYGDLK